jgi:hypothetical protein
MAGGVEDLFPQPWWNFDRLKSPNRSPAEKRFQHFAHDSPLCCYYNIDMLQMQHVIRNVGARSIPVTNEQAALSLHRRVSIFPAALFA